MSITLGNVGWASIINERPAFLVLTGDGSTHRIPLNVDPRSWKSGQEVTIEQSIDIPAELKPGSYSLALWLPDQYESLREKAAYSVRFANDGVWDAKTGYNELARLEVADPRPALAATGAGDAAALAGPAALSVAIGGAAILLVVLRRRRRLRGE